MNQNGQHNGWVFSVYYSSPTHWAYIATKETQDRQASGTVKATNAAEAKAAVIGLIDSHNLNESEMKE
jgi:hypothetical protein